MEEEKEECEKQEMWGIRNWWEIKWVLVGPRLYYRGIGESVWILASSKYFIIPI